MRLLRAPPPCAVSYRPTQKNAQVATFYPDHGFVTTGEGRFEAALPLALVADHVTIQRHA